VDADRDNVRGACRSAGGLPRGAGRTVGGLGAYCVAPRLFDLLGIMGCAESDELLRAYYSFSIGWMGIPMFWTEA